MLSRVVSSSALLSLSLLAPVARAQTTPVRPAVIVPAAELPDLAAEEGDLQTFEAAARARAHHPTPSLAPPKATEVEAVQTPQAQHRLYAPAHLSFVPMVSTGGFSDPKLATSLSLGVVASHVGEVRGVQLSSAANSTSGKMHGFQGAGAVNVAAGDANGAQFAGAVNIAAGKVHGIQAAGAVNVAAESISGAQFSGAVNVAGRVDVGAQIGVVNIGGDVSGAQIGVVNIARHVKGAQVGVLNFADDVEGATVGLLSFVRKGQLHFDLWSSDTSVMNASVRLGSKRVYSLVNFGLDPMGERNRWTAGLGLGVRADAGRLFFTLDGSVNNTYRTLFTTSNNNLLTQVRLLGGVKLFKHFALFGGPTLNVNVNFDRVEEFGFRWGWESDTRKVRVWPGFAAGIEI